MRRFLAIGLEHIDKGRATDVLVEAIRGRHDEEEFVTRALEARPEHVRHRQTLTIAPRQLKPNNETEQGESNRVADT